MSDRLTPLPIDLLLKRILTEYEQRGSIFGIYAPLFFHASPDDVFRMERYSTLLETPVGVAAGPHSQLSQNIVAAWLCGARYIELKTVQTLDELDVAKPCIDMEDEGYNCEWSQELKLRQSHEEYLNAWIILHILRHKFSMDSGKGPGFIFNMSAGYDLAGIRNENMQEYFDLMEDSSHQLNEKLELLKPVYPDIDRIAIPPQISNSLTISTMHGCPSDEIEKIGRYFLEERRYHTTLKLNPTLLGVERVRDILNKQLGYQQVEVPDAAFEHDLKWEDALNIIGNLQASAAAQGLQFGLKLTNTLEVENRKSVFPESENMAYLSGRPLHPISINLGDRLQSEFHGALDISFSAGIDAFNIADVLACNFKPVTTCSDLLKPGGYTRLGQYLTGITEAVASTGAHSLEDYILKLNGSDADVQGAGMSNLTAYAESVCADPHYHARVDAFENIKTARSLGSFDCISAPCTGHCATDQEIPRYMYYTAIGEFEKAAEVVRRTNPFPGVTGYVCDHLCQLKCTRNNIDNTLLIREIKRFIVEQTKMSNRVSAETSPTSSAAIIGAGPSGLSCAYFLAVSGFNVTVYEAKESPGGMVSGSIPEFRLPGGVTSRDISSIEALGVTLHYGGRIDSERLKTLKSEYDYLYLSVGAALNKKLKIPGEDLPGVMDPIRFLSAVKSGNRITPGRRIGVIGGGNTAIDAARTALRLAGEGGEVTLLYRRTRLEMPAEWDEVEDALKEGIRLIQLVAPEKIELSDEGALRLTCAAMELSGERDAGGRRMIRKSSLPGSSFEFDTIIPAIGQDVEAGLLEDSDELVIPVTQNSGGGRIFFGGDAYRGASSVVNAVGDGKKAAEQILLRAGKSSHRIHRHKLELKDDEYQQKLARCEYGPAVEDFVRHEPVDFNLISRTMTPDEAQKEAARCLYCDEVCNICVSVCPNLANLGYQTEPAEYRIQSVTHTADQVKIVTEETFRLAQTRQVLNIGDFCNECGDCTTFCPTSGRPFADKPKIYLSEGAFETEQGGYFFDGESLHFLENDLRTSLTPSDDGIHYHSPEMRAILDPGDLAIRNAALNDECEQADTRRAVQMAILLKNAEQIWMSQRAAIDENKKK